MTTAVAAPAPRAVSGALGLARAAAGRAPRARCARSSRARARRADVVYTTGDVRARRALGASLARRPFVAQAHRRPGLRARAPARARRRRRRRVPGERGGLPSARCASRATSSCAAPRTSSVRARTCASSRRLGRPADASPSCRTPRRVPELRRARSCGARSASTAPTLAFAGRLTAQKSLERRARRGRRSRRRRRSWSPATAPSASSSSGGPRARLDGRVRFLGAQPRERVLELFRAADASLLSSTLGELPAHGRRGARRRDAGDRDRRRRRRRGRPRRRERPARRAGRPDALADAIERFFATTRCANACAPARRDSVERLRRTASTASSRRSSAGRRNEAAPALRRPPSLHASAPAVRAAQVRRHERRARPPRPRERGRRLADARRDVHARPAASSETPRRARVPRSAPVPRRARAPRLRARRRARAGRARGGIDAARSTARAERDEGHSRRARRLAYRDAAVRIAHAASARTPSPIASPRGRCGASTRCARSPTSRPGSSASSASSPSATFPAFMDLDPFLTPPVPLPERPVALFVGALERYKGLDLLVDAWPNVAEQLPDAELRLIGAGARERRVARLSSSVRAARDAGRPGSRRRRSPAALDRATVLVLPSRSRGDGTRRRRGVLSRAARSSARAAAGSRTSSATARTACSFHRTTHVRSRARSLTSCQVANARLASGLWPVRARNSGTRHPRSTRRASERS